MASAVDSRLAYARLSAVATASRLPTANRGSNNSYTTSWDTTRPTTREEVCQWFERFLALAAEVSAGEDIELSDLVRNRIANEPRSLWQLPDLRATLAALT